MIATIAIIICFLLNFSMAFEERASELNFKAWDMYNTTASDFGLQLVITQNHWKAWMEYELKEL